ncbi:MAG TPA: HAMP domain-containing sensor histidine kinase [Acidimicrobiales bacterium]|nr:HAMP domain-containing sensor histidine kinase [Acidimicrobiales bacterium]
MRLRLTAAGTFLAAATFAVGTSLVITLYHRTLVADVDATALAKARGTADALSPRALVRPLPMPVAPGVPRIQVLGADNTVLTGDPASAVSPAIAVLPPGRVVAAFTVLRPAFMPVHRARVAVVRQPPAAGERTVIAVLSLDEADAKARQATHLALIALGGSLVVVFAVAWLVAGRALRPVEELRAEVAAITGQGDVARRVAGADRADEIGALAVTLNDLLGRLDRAAMRQRQFVADAAHELRTPVAGATTALEVAAANPDPAATAAAVRESIEALTSMAALISELLLLAAADEQRLAALKHPVDLAGIVVDASRRATPPGVTIRTGRIDRACTEGDAGQLERVVANLVSNAVRHARSLVWLSLAVEGPFAVLDVEDDGAGIPPADRERVWERFVRLDGARSRGSGSGLGLAIVRELVALHGGTVHLDESPALHGARFRVVLRLAPVAGAPDAGAHLARRAAPLSAG